MRKGQRLELSVTALDGDGAGLADLEGVQIHVAGALPGELVEAEVAHRSPHRHEAWATIGRILRASPSRVPPVCPAYGACGGCTLQHLRYEDQLQHKTDRVRQALAARPTLAEVAVGGCVPSPRPLGYRDKAKLVYARSGDRVILGAFRPRTHEVVDLAGCAVSEPPLDAVASTLLDLLAAHGVAPFDERLREGVLRYVVLRVNHHGHVLAALVTAIADWPEGPELARALQAARPDVIGVVQNVNASRGNTLFGEEERLLAGVSDIEDQVGGIHVRLSASAFFQINRGVAARIYGDVAQAAALTGIERVVDCYTGVGGIALTLAPRAAEVIGIEEHPSAARAATSSALLNHATRTRFIAGEVEHILGELDDADVVILNPPRRGCTAPVLAAVARLHPRLIAYVSCAPDTLARDLERLAALGYQTQSVRPYDMLPHTPHVEALAVLTPG